MPLLDQRIIPDPSVLLAEDHELALRRDPGGATSLGQKHQRQQTGHLAVLRKQRADQSRHPDRLGGQVGAHRVGVGAGREVPLVEDEEQHGQHTGDPRRQVLRGGHPIRDAGRRDLALRAGDPLPHGVLLHEEGAGDLWHGQTSDHAQSERHSCVHGEGRVTAGEDQPEPVVVDGAERFGRVVVDQHQSLSVFVVALVLAPDPVDRLAIGGRGEPRAGVRRDAVGWPPLDGGRECLGRRLFGDVEVAEALGE